MQVMIRQACVICGPRGRVSMTQAQNLTLMPWVFSAA